MNMIKLTIKRTHRLLLVSLLLLFSGVAGAQQLLLLDNNAGNKPVNDGVIEVDTTDLSALELSAHLKIQNNTGKTLAVFMKKIINQMVDSTSNYFCLNPKCWPGADSTDIPDSIPAGVGDSSFVTHYDHYFRYERPVPPGFTSITYLFYDHTTFPSPVEARVTINYHISGVGIPKPVESISSVFPVPSPDLVHFTFTGLNDPVEKVIIVDEQGRTVWSSSLPVVGNEYLLDAGSYENGIYLAVLRHRGGMTESRRLIVQH